MTTTTRGIESFKEIEERFGERAGRKSQVASRRSQVASRKSQVAGRRWQVRDGRPGAGGGPRQKPANCLKDSARSAVCSLVTATETKGHHTKDTPLAVPDPNHNPLGPPWQIGVWLATFILLALAVPRLELAAGVLHRETFDTDPGWRKSGDGAPWGTMVVADGQAVMQFNRMEATNPDFYLYWVSNFSPRAPGWPVRFGPDRTLELRADVIQFSQEDAFVAVAVYGEVNITGYSVLLERNEIVLNKFGMTPTGWGGAIFLWESVALPSTPLTLSAGFTQVGDHLLIHLRILDRTEQTVLWERKVWDTAGNDPVLPNRSVRGLLMGPEPFVAPYTWQDMYPYVAIAYANTTTAPTEPIEVIIDNVEVREYGAPVAEIEKAVRLSWPADTLEEQIVVGADTLGGPWRPWPAPIYQQSGRCCMAAPITTAQQWFESEKYFRLVPGTQFIDNFDPPRWPYASKGDWVPYFYNPAYSERLEIKNTGNALRICTVTVPSDAQALLLPPGSNELVFGDFCVTVDLLEIAFAGQDEEIAIGARGWLDPTEFPGKTTGYSGGLILVPPGRARLFLFDGENYDPGGPLFYLDPEANYRLEFSGVGNDLAVRLVNLKNQQSPVEDRRKTDTKWQQGGVGLFFQANSSSYAFTVDNFFVTGTKPKSP